MYNVYTHTREGKELLASNVSYREAEIYRECCRNCSFEDTANSGPDDLAEIEGMVEKGKYFSARVVVACVCLAPVVIMLALITQNQ